MKQFEAISNWLPVMEYGGEMSFFYEGWRYFTSEFLKIHGSPWMSDEEYPDYIRAVGQTITGQTIYLAIDSYKECVQLYQEVKENR